MPEIEIQHHRARHHAPTYHPNRHTLGRSNDGGRTGAAVAKLPQTCRMDNVNRMGRVSNTLERIASQSTSAETNAHLL